MSRSSWARPLLGAVLLLISCASARADEVPAPFRASVERGLKWLRVQAHKAGPQMSWHGTDGDYAVSLTALAGMAFLMEGSTLREGKYCAEVRGATGWL